MYPAFGWNVLYISVKSIGSNALFNACFLIFCLVIEVSGALVYLNECFAVYSPLNSVQCHAFYPESKSMALYHVKVILPFNGCIIWHSVDFW